MTRATTATEARAITLLGSGVTPEQCASACGVTVSRISQLLSDPEFTAEVAELRFKNLQGHNERDSRYDSLEDRLLAKLEDLLPMMMRPLEVLRAIQTINGAKRRGQSAPEQVTAQQTVVSITMPSVVVQRFVTNIQNQVIQAGEQQLLTVQSSSLLREAQAAQLTALGISPNTTGVPDDLTISQQGTNSSGGVGSQRTPALPSLPATSPQQRESRSYPPSSFIPVGS